MTTSREVRLKSRPVGLPTADNFELATVTLPAPAAGEIQVRNDWMTVDPYMRGRMNDAKSYSAPFALGEAMHGGAVGTVIVSGDEGFKPGDLVQSNYGWREAFNAHTSMVQKIDTMGLPPQTFLLRVAGLKEGDVVFVSAASGAVGSMVCQIAKLKGHKVIGSAGGADKVRFLKEELGVDEVIDYKAVPDLMKALEAAAPEGIDVYFENVGGEHLEAALNSARPFARFALCGMISMYNATTPPPGPRNIALAVGKQIRMEGFIVSSHYDLLQAFHHDLAEWHAAGKLKWKETVVEGIERAPEAFLKLFSGENFGKMLVKLT
jgi:NADPH-dependent curcumin reductase CurA